MEILDFKIGEVLNWNEAVKIIKEKMTVEKLKYACSGCEWQIYGICESALLKAKRKNLT